MRKKWISGSLAGLAAMGTPAFAQVATDANAGPGNAVNSQQIAEIVVTANKRAESIQSVPMSITALSGDDLAKRNITDAKDLVRVVPGFSYVEASNSIPVYSLRGIGFYDTSISARPTVSVYTDQAPLPFSIMAQNMAFDLERIEVLKGPQGTLFGQNATGGAINYIAAKPTSTLRAGVDATLSRFDSVDGSAYISGPITSTLKARIAVRRVFADGWQKSYTRGDTLGKQNLTQGRLLIDWDPTSRLKIAVNLNGMIDHSDTQAGQLIGVLYSIPARANLVPQTATYPLAPHNDRAADWDPELNYAKNNRFYQATMRADYSLSDQITLTSLFSRSRFKVQQTSDQDGSSLDIFHLDQNGSVSSTSEELRVAGKFGQTNIIAGGNYSDDHAHELNIVSYPYGTSAFANLAYGVGPGLAQQSDQVFKTKAAFLAVDQNLTSQLILHGGVRYTSTKDAYSGCSRDYNGYGFPSVQANNARRAALGLAPVPYVPGACTTVDPNLNPGLVSGNLDEHNVSWRAGIDWKPSTDQLLYANVSRGYKAGGAPTVASPSSVSYVPVTQESVTAYEVGFKTSLLSRRLTLNGAAFYYDYTDKQLKGRIVTNPNTLGPQESLVNVPKSRILGGEAQLQARPVRGLTLNLGATYLDTKIRGSFPNTTLLGTAADFGGEAFPYTPKWQAVGDVEYSKPLNDHLTGMVGLSATTRTGTYSGFGENDILHIDGYTLVDARAGISGGGGRWRAEVFGANIFNKYYWTNVVKLGDSVRRLSGRPATYGLRLSYHY